MNEAGSKARAVAAETIDAVAGRGQSLDAAIAANEQQLPADDRPLMRMMSYGVLRNYWLLQSWVDQLLSRPLRKNDRVVNALLLAGLYQIAHMRIPDHAVVSETVEATRRLRRPKLAGLVNACLRRFVREAIAEQPPKGDQATWNHPQWLVDRIRKDWPQDWQAILKANNARAPMWLRANPSRAGVDDYQQRLQNAGIEAHRLPGFDDALRLSEPVNVAKLPGFDAGDASVQDAAAQLAARWLLSEPRNRVLDACAAPGGKTGHLLEIGAEQMALTAIDNDPERLPSIRQNVQRIGQNATILGADASNPEEWWDGTPFDAILLDAPCSATGVIRRHPDIKLLRRERDLKHLTELQSRLISALWSLIAPGGRLIYATCSVLSSENDEVTTQFLQDNGDAIENDLLPNNNIRDLMRRKACGYQILPGTADMDGFYYAAFQKQKVS